MTVTAMPTTTFSREGVQSQEIPERVSVIGAERKMSSYDVAVFSRIHSRLQGDCPEKLRRSGGRETCSTVRESLRRGNLTMLKQDSPSLRKGGIGAVPTQRSTERDNDIGCRNLTDFALATLNTSTVTSSLKVCGCPYGPPYCHCTGCTDQLRRGSFCSDPLVSHTT